MKIKQGVDTEELIKNLLREKIELTKLNFEKDKVIISLNNRLRRYEGDNKNGK